MLNQSILTGNWVVCERTTINTVDDIHATEIINELRRGAHRRSRCFIVASRSNDDTVYRINDKVVEGEIVSWLRSLISIHTAGVGDDEMFGTPTPKAVGETWSVREEEIRKLLKEMGSPGDRERVSGSSKLESIDSTHMVVSSRVEMNDMRLPLPEQMTATNGMATVEYLGRVPLSQAHRSQTVSGKIKIAVIGTRPTESGDIKFETTLNTQSRYEVRPLIRDRTK